MNNNTISYSPNRNDYLYYQHVNLKQCYCTTLPTHSLSMINKYRVLYTLYYYKPYTHSLRDISATLGTPICLFCASRIQTLPTIVHRSSVYLATYACTTWSLVQHKSAPSAISPPAHMTGLPRFSLLILQAVSFTSVL